MNEFLFIFLDLTNCPSLSHQLWMCGGMMLNMPCSRVGHVYRRNVPYTYDKPNAVLINFKRVAEVWMGDFKEFLYQRRPEIRHQKHGMRKSLLGLGAQHSFDYPPYLFRYLKRLVRSIVHLPLSEEFSLICSYDIEVGGEEIFVLYSFVK